MFIDEARVLVAGGRGGDGAVSFHREKYRSKGRPDGGSGGRGGSVTLVANTEVGSLIALRDHPHQRAAPGAPGGPNGRTGAGGSSLTLRVPVGTTVKDEAGITVADLAAPEDTFVVAQGGRGGRGNAAFLSPNRRAPGFAELGEAGEERWIRLELRLIADAAVIGYPNVGKSTLVAALSAARPKIADYPFTTLDPTLGVVVRDDERFTICDIPGLIEGAHEGRGLGLRFLRHAERAAAFVHLVDLAADRDPLEDYERVRREIEAFRTELGQRPEVVALNKIDAVPADRVTEASARFRARGIDPVAISAAYGRGLQELLERIFTLVEAARGQPRDGFELFRTSPTRMQVAREADAWRLTGGALERWVAMTDLVNPEGLVYLQERLERAGVERALTEAGVRPGDEVRVGDAVFEWWPNEGIR